MTKKLESSDKNYIGTIIKCQCASTNMLEINEKSRKSQQSDRKTQQGNRRHEHEQKFGAEKCNKKISGAQQQNGRKEEQERVNLKMKQWKLPNVNNRHKQTKAFVGL